jgi:hypothetical protein
VTLAWCVPRIARETAQQALTEWGIGLHRTVVDAALPMLSRRPP